MKAHSVCEESVEPPAVTRAREILEECGIVDVQGTPADQLRPLVELVEELNTRRLEKYNAPEPFKLKPVVDPFVVKHYTGSDRPIIKGNGFDGLEVGETREEAEEFIAFVNLYMGAKK
jgi:hypothetical protein